MNCSSLQLAAIVRLFSPSVFREMARSGRSDYLRRLLTETGLAESCRPNTTVGEAFDSAFKILRVAGHRNEHVYRSAIINKVLLGTHSLNSASMLNEFRVRTSKADLVILNETATVYEIKSERDSLARLVAQIDNYYRVFGRVNVIASESHVAHIVKSVPSCVGVLCLSNRYQISTVREATDCTDRICPVTVLESLRAAEAVEILESLDIPVPQVPNTRRHALLRELFAPVDPVMLHKEMVQTLRKTRNQAPLQDLVSAMPYSLKAAALTVSVRRSDHGRLIDAVRTPLSPAMT